jgi:RHS repeat-associated protein
MLNKEYSDKGSPYAEYYIANNQVVSQKMFGLHGLVTPGKEESLKTTGGLMYYQYDRGNTVTELTDRHGDEIEHYRYDAFGNIFTGITSPYNTTGYTEQDYDDVAGLVQMDARWYSPSIGRFTSQDTYMGDMYSSQSLNRYSYVMNNPTNMWDPTGHVPEWVGEEVHFIYKSDSQLDDVYVLKSSSSSESGWNLIDTTDNKVNKILKYKATRTYTWNYDHYDFNYTEVKDSETGEISYELKNVTYTLDSFIEKNTYYKEVVVSAAQIASENEQYIKNLAGDPPKNTDPPAYSSSRVNQKFKQVWSSNQVIVNNTGSNSTYAEKQTTGVVQSMLNDIMDRDLEVNKSYGNDTKQSVTDFQKVSNLTANGNLDVKTFNQIMNVYGQYDEYMDILENAGEYRSGYISSIQKKLNDLVAPYRDKGTGKTYVTADQLKQLGWNNVNDEMVRSLNDILVKYDITTPERIRHFISQAMQESGLGLYTKELASGEAYEGRDDLGNTQPGDGPKYKGAGYIQMTGRANYQAFSDFMGDPDIMKGVDYVSANYAWEAAGFWWKDNEMNAIVDSLVGASIDQKTLEVSKVVNRGNRYSKKMPKHYENRKTYYKQTLEVIN